MDPAFAAELRSFMHELADLSADAIVPYFRTGVAVDDKGGNRGFNPVTAADREAERVVRAAIETRYPDHAISGEEFPDKSGSGRYRWIIDPIDGTQAFICGLPTWGTLIGFCDSGRPVLGIMNQPYVGERFIGGCHEVRLHTRTADRELVTGAGGALAQAVLFATSPAMFQPGEERAAFEKLSGAVRVTRFGVDCYAYCLLAAGHIDLVVEAGISFHDIAALIPIVECAGGIVSDWDGAPVRAAGRVIAASNPALHGTALEYLKLPATGIGR